MADSTVRVNTKDDVLRRAWLLLFVVMRYETAVFVVFGGAIGFCVCSCVLSVSVGFNFIALTCCNDHR